MADYSYLGSGKISLRVAGSAAPLLAIGNCSALSFNVNEDVKTQKDYTQPGGGTYNEVRRIESIEMALTMAELSPENLARALYGSVDVISTTPIVGEVLGNGYKGGLLRFAKVPNITPAPVLKHAQFAAAARANSTVYALNAYYIPAAPNGFVYKVTTGGTSAAAPPVFPVTIGGTIADGTATITNVGRGTLTLNTDYEVTAGGVRLLTGAAVFATDGEAFIADYTPYAGNVVQALTSGGKEYEIVFEGLNEAASSKPVIVSVFRGKLGATQSVTFIGDDYASMEVSGKVLKDTTKTGVGVSTYFTVAMVA
jgi:hypothetical protein